MDEKSRFSSPRSRQLNVIEMHRTTLLLEASFVLTKAQQLLHEAAP